MHICPKVRGLQNSDLNTVGWNNICHRARLHFCKLVRCMWLSGLTVWGSLAQPFVQWSPIQRTKLCGKLTSSSTSYSNIFCNIYIPVGEFWLPPWHKQWNTLSSLFRSRTCTWTWTWKLELTWRWTYTKDMNMNMNEHEHEVNMSMYKVCERVFW